MDLYKKIIDECYKYKRYCKQLGLFWMGEPLLDPNFFEKVKYAKKKKSFFILAYSNGSLLTKENCQKLIDSRIDRMIFSIDGASQETYESVRIGLSYEEVVRGIKRLIILKRELGLKMPRIEIQMVQTPFNEHESDLFKKTWKGWADNFYIKKMHAWNGESIDKSLINYSHRLMGTKHEQIHPCFYLWKSLVVAQDGRVALCCVDSRVQEEIGDLTKETIYNVWHGEKINQIRKLHLDGETEKIPICQRCTFRQIKDCPWWWEALFHKNK